MRATRKRVRILILAAMVAAAAVGAGFALSLEPSTPIGITSSSLPVAKIAVPVPKIAVNLPVAVVTAKSLSTGPISELPDALKLFGLGTILLALAAVVKRTV